MERGSAKHSQREDDALKDELSGMLQGNRPTRAQRNGAIPNRPPTTIRTYPSRARPTAARGPPATRRSRTARAPWSGR